MKRFTIIAFTHKNLDLDEVGMLHLEDTIQRQHLKHVQDTLELEELMYVSTCNRVEFYLVSNETVNDQFITRFFKLLPPIGLLKEHQKC